ncbi:MAG: SRPBCC domain-containing protein [Bacteroidales bacterium]|nr:SRPBCC domain-containing protein [Bacteroidales bacterium]MBK7628709.1 SRPBCC domain-containing protein [Bacteroidales bacterium]
MKTFKTSRYIPVPPESIFAAFTDPERFARWWGPSGFTNTFSQFNFKIGGKWSFIMHGPDGVDYPNEAEFIDIVPNEKVVIRHLVQPYFTLTILITKSITDSLVNWIQEFDSEEVAESVAHIVEPANEQNLDRLVAEVCKV